MSKEKEIHGLAATIRSATSSETFDLGGLPSTTISQVVRDAFSRDFDLERGEMIRLTFVVGAGKGNRTKYDPEALKIVTKSLSAAGYVEDRGASCVVESAGCFKFQHDTGKNLKTVVVFPKIIEAGTGNSTNSLPQGSSLLPPGSLEYKIAVSTVPLFSNMLKAKFPSWFQKRSLLKLMDEALALPLDNLDAVLMKGGLLSDDENKFYEQCVSISEKKALVKDAMSQQVKDEKLTAREVTFLLDQALARMEELRSKKRAIPDALQERHAKLQSIAKNPIPLPPLKHHAALAKLWKQAAPLMYLSASGGKLLSPAETKKRAQLEEILCEIVELEESSRGLLEEDESYEEKIQTYRRNLQQRYGNIIAGRGSQNKKRAPGNTSSSSSKNSNAWNSTTKFQTPTFGAKGRGGWNSAKAKKPKSSSLKNGGLFGAMMADSDSDDEDDDNDNDEKQVDTNVTCGESPISGGPSATTGRTNGKGANGKGANKRKKKKKNKRSANNVESHQDGDDDDALLQKAIARNNADSKNRSVAVEKQKSDNGFSVLSILLSGLTEWVFPAALTFCVWVASVLFGKNKKKIKK